MPLSLLWIQLKSTFSRSIMSAFATVALVGCRFEQNTAPSPLASGIAVEGTLQLSKMDATMIVGNTNPLVRCAGGVIEVADAQPATFAGACSC